jgi:uncharacterized membrane protein YfcA
VRKLLVIAIVGFAAQLVDGALGMAYGVTSSSLMLVAGLSPAAASASVHLSELGTTLVSGASHWRFGNVDWRMVLRLGVPGAVGAFAGATLLSGLSTEAATPWMAAILLFLGLYVLLRFTFGRIRTGQQGRPLRSRFLSPLGLIAGFIDATGGGGWGPVATPTLLVSGRVEPRKVIGSVDTSEFMVAAAASIGFFIGIGNEGVKAGYVLALLAGGLAAAPLAAYLVRRIAPKMLGSLVGGIIVLTNARTLVREFEITGLGAAAIYISIVIGWAAAVAWSYTSLRRERAAVTPAPAGRDEWVSRASPRESERSGSVNASVAYD